jgi:rare lipoprotein A (peptidoglycan hydrolase)
MKQLLAALFVLVLLSPVPGQTDTTRIDSLQTQNASKVVLSDSLKPEFPVYMDSGVASWYGPNWKGRLTASGEYFDPDSMTAAHKSLPFGTIVKVTNLSNDSVIYVRITDRLPKKSSRSIDLTPVAAKKLGFYSKGLQKVRMEAVGTTPVRKKTISVGAIQGGY